MDLARQAAGIGALADPSRRALYEYVVGQDDAVGREAAAAAVGLAVSTAGFHLDKLVGERLLETEFRRLTGRTGPGAGRPSKLYRRSQTQFAVSLPQRRYDLVGQILAGAVDRAATGEDLTDALADCAAQQGRELGAEAQAGGAAADPDALSSVLATQGYEPRVVTTSGEPQARAAGVCIELGNCPFDQLARRHTELVCGLNQHYIQGVADGLGAASARADLEPDEHRCCVTVSMPT